MRRSGQISQFQRVSLLDNVLFSKVFEFFGLLLLVSSIHAELIELISYWRSFHYLFYLRDRSLFLYFFWGSFRNISRSFRQACLSLIAIRRMSLDNCVVGKLDSISEVDWALAESFLIEFKTGRVILEAWS